MLLSGLEVAPLNSIQDCVRVAAWYRRGQLRLFETLISVYSNVLSINPDVMKSVQKSLDTYFELIAPGTKEYMEKEDKNFIKQQQKTMDSIFSLLSDYEGQRKNIKVNNR